MLVGMSVFPVGKHATANIFYIRTKLPQQKFSESFLNTIIMP